MKVTQSNLKLACQLANEAGELGLVFYVSPGRSNQPLLYILSRHMGQNLVELQDLEAVANFLQGYKEGKKCHG